MNAINPDFDPRLSRQSRYQFLQALEAQAEHLTTRSGTVVVEDDAAVTLAPEHNRCVVVLAASGAVTVTVPTDADGGFDPDTWVTLVSTGAGGVTVDDADGVTVSNKTGFDPALATGGWALLVKTDEDEWSLVGDLVETGA